MSKVDLAIFGCEYRQHFASGTYRSFRERCSYNFDDVVVSWDGHLQPDALHDINATYILQSTEREGYVRSILRWLRFTDSDYFFWLEDDWGFNQQIDLGRMLRLLQSNEDWVQIKLSKRVLSEEEREVELASGIFRTEPVRGITFSANPCLCRTDVVREGFEWMLSEAGDEEKFEWCLTRWVAENDRTCGVVDPGDEPGVEHQGYIEYTDRSTWHSVGMARGNAEATSSGDEASASVKSRVAMVVRLLSKALLLSFQQLTSDKAHDLARRIYRVDYKDK